MTDTANVLYEKHDDIVILRVIGGITFPELAEAMRLYFPLVTKHLIWDYTNGNLDNVTPSDFKSVPEIAKKYFTDRPCGKTAFACPNDYVYGMFRMYTVFADMKDMPFEYSVHRSMDEALRAVRS